MLAVALIIGQMTAGLRYQARVASYREERARVLYEFARDMSSKLLTADVVESATRIIANTIRAKVAILVPDDQDRIQRGRPRAGTGDRRRRRAVGVRQGAAGRRGHRHARRQRIPVSAVAGADAHARRAGDQARQSAAAARAGAAPAPRHLRGADRHRAGARALRGSRAAGAHQHGVRAPAQFAAVGAVARPADAACRAGGAGGIAGAHPSAAVAASSSNPRTRSPRKRGG